MSPRRVAVEVEVDVHVFPEAAGVVVAVGFGVSESLEDAVGLQEHVLHTTGRQKNQD